jgi:hypothetical protein
VLTVYGSPDIDRSRLVDCDQKSYLEDAVDPRMSGPVGETRRFVNADHTGHSVKNSKLFDKTFFHRVLDIRPVRPNTTFETSPLAPSKEGNRWQHFSL